MRRPTTSRPPIAGSRASITPTCPRKRTPRQSSRRWPRPTKRSRIPEKRAAYDQLGSHAPGQEFRPPPDWDQQFAQGQGGFEDIDLESLFAGLGRAAGTRRRAGRGLPDGRQRLRGRRAPFLHAGVPRHGNRSRALDARMESRRRRAARAAPRQDAHSPRRRERRKVARPGQGRQRRQRGSGRRPLSRHRSRRASAVSRGRQGCLHRSAADAVGGDSRHEREVAHARRRRDAQGAGRHAGGAGAAPVGARHDARQRRSRPPVRGGAHRSADGRGRQAEGALQGARRHLQLQSARPFRTGGRPR